MTDAAYLPESPDHDAAIEAINEEAFGPGRFARAAYKIREAGGHDRRLSFVAVVDGAVIASVRMTPIAAGAGRAYLLGPLAVPVRVMLWTPASAEVMPLIVSMLLRLPGVSGLTEKPTEVPAGLPEAESVTLPLRPE